jgi:hypothetical protein
MALFKSGRPTRITFLPCSHRASVKSPPVTGVHCHSAPFMPGRWPPSSSSRPRWYKSRAPSAVSIFFFSTARAPNVASIFFRTGDADEPISSAPPFNLVSTELDLVSTIPAQVVAASAAGVPPPHRPRRHHQSTLVSSTAPHCRKTESPLPLLYHGTLGSVARRWDC